MKDGIKYLRAEGEAGRGNAVAPLLYNKKCVRVECYK